VELEKMPKSDFFDSLAIYRRNFNPEIFTDITTPVKQSYSPNTGKISLVLEASKFINLSIITLIAMIEHWIF